MADGGAAAGGEGSAAAPAAAGGAAAPVNNGAVAGGEGAAAAPAAAPIQQAPEFLSLIPETFREKPWVKETKDVGALFNRVEGLMAEIGKRPAGIPQENAKPEDWEKFNKAFGVPDKPEEYELTPGTPEAPVDEQFQGGIKKVFKNAGVSKRQAAILEKGYNELLAQLTPDPAAVDAEFDTLTKDVFGDRKDEALKGANALITKFAPAAMADRIAKLGNHELVILAGVIDGIRKEYISEDRMPTGGNAPAGMTPEQKRARGLELMASKEYQDPFHPNHAKVKQEVERLYGTEAK